MTKPRLFQAASLAGLALLGMACGHSGGQPGSTTSPPGGGGGPTVSYSSGLFVLAIGETLAPELPTVTGGVDSWSISPALPAGMAFDSMTGGISGTPTTRAPLGLYQVLATNISGSTLVPLGIRVTGESRFAYGASDVDGSLAVFGLEGTAGTLFHQGWISATTSGTEDLVADPFGRFLSTVDGFNLVTYLIDAASGQLSLGGAANLGSGPHSVGTSPGGDYTIVTSRGSDRIRSYAIAPTTGAPTLAAERFTGMQPEEVVVDPLGRYALVRHAFDATPGSEKTLLVSYLIDAASGDLITSATLELLLSDATAMSLSPTGEHLYLTLAAPFPTVLHCTMDTSTGLPSLVATADAGTTPVALEVEPEGRRLYVVNQGSNDVTVFDIDPADGSLSAIAALPSSAGGDGLSFSDDGTELFVVDSAARDVTVHGIDPVTGLSTGSQTFRTRSGSSALAQVAGDTAIARRAKDLYVANFGSDDLVAYELSSTTGAMDDSGLPPLTAGTDPAGLVVDPLGRFVYVGCVGSNEVIAYGIQPNGDLIDLMLPTPFAGGDPRHMAIDLAGRYLYVVVDFFDLLLAYSIQPDGSLIVHNSRPLADNPESITIDPTGTFIYVTLGGNGTTELGEIAVYAINSQNGNLIDLPVIAAPGHPVSLGFDPAGSKAYVTFLDTDRVQPFDVGISGDLTAIGAGSDTQNEPREIEITRDGLFAFAAFEDTANQGGLLLYNVNTSTGELFNADAGGSDWLESVNAGDGPLQVDVTPERAFVYVMARTEGVIDVFSSDPVSGKTTNLGLDEFPGVLPTAMGLNVVIE